MSRIYSGPLRPAALLAAAALAVVPVACGSDDPADEVEAPVERAQQVPKLPDGWKVERVDAGGYALGVPPGWRAQARDARAQLTSPDELVVVTVTPDRSNEAIEADLEELAQTTAVQYGEQFEKFELGRSDRYDHAYDAFVVRAGGKHDGVGQEIEVIVLRRGELVTFTVIVQRNERFGTGAYAPTIERIVRSIRSRPVG
jgi:hypothetical protein